MNPERQAPRAPKVSFIVPAHNEADMISRTLESLAASAAACGLACEIIVVDDASTDATADVAARHGARVVPIDRRQIAAARNAGARTATGKILVFIDADTTLTPAVLEAMTAALDRGAIGGGARVMFDEQLPVAARLTVWIWTGLSRLLHWAAGCFVFIDRNVFERIGGFDERYFAGEELVFSQRAKDAGRFVILAEPVTTSARKVRDHGSLKPLWVLTRLAIQGPRAWRKRQGLEFWYPPTKEPPDKSKSDPP